MSDKLDKFLAFGSSFNWFKELDDLAKDLTNDYKEFVCDRSQSVNSVRRKLKKAGITIWGVEYQDDTFTFRVKAEQEDRARKLL